MSEYTIPLEQLLDEPSLNGHSEAGEPEVAGPRVDPKRSIFITSKGDEIEMSNKRITSLYLDRITNQGKPKIPMVEVLLLGKHKQLEAHPNDPNYLALLAEWKEESYIRMFKYLIAVGVKGQPPQEFIDEQRVYFPDADDQEMKYLYFASLIPDDDVGFFVEAMMGKNAPTAAGTEESAASFRSPG